MEKVILDKIHDSLALEIAKRFSFPAVKAGDITANIAATPIAVAPYAGTIRQVRISLGNTGEDAANPLSIEVDVLKNGTSIFPSTTKPSLSKADADYATVVAVPDTVNFVEGDFFTYTATLTRTASPTDEMADLVVSIE